MGQFDGRTALVTGATAGIELAVVRSLVEEGAHVFIVVRDRGRLDVVFANAGGGEFAPPGAIKWAHYAHTSNANVGGVLNPIQGGLPFLIVGAFVILTRASTDSKGKRSFSVYAATTAVIRALGRSWAVEFAENDIRMNVVASRPDRNAQHNWNARQNRNARQERARLGTRTSRRAARRPALGVPMHRLSTPDEITNAVLRLASLRLRAASSPASFSASTAAKARSSQS